MELDNRATTAWNRFAEQILVYLLTILSTIFLSGIQEPTLPPVQIQEEQAKKVSLLSHANGYWYVFNNEGKLTAIPDSHAGTVAFPKGSTQWYLEQ